ncbi:hypothetical protein SteCoe_24653 [Stentor coeruleus]|uniref:Uncharacterized protein n=1 Tax=Stentor coeruleus TaxID=5963 RepID=A0A1R2BH62_9CILI|nr:hypothetical protein SteCoe_24653 [Stentor coeruleus]
MNLAHCKLIESCDKVEIRKKNSLSPIYTLPDTLKSKISTFKLPKLSTSPANSPCKISNTPSNEKGSGDFILNSGNLIGLDLRVSCRKSRIFKVSPKEVMRESRKIKRINRFILIQANENTLSNYFRPKCLTPMAKRTNQFPASSQRPVIQTKGLYSFKNLKNDIVFTIP